MLLILNILNDASFFGQSYDLMFCLHLLMYTHRVCSMLHITRIKEKNIFLNPPCLMLCMSMCFINSVK